jgi:glutathione S-transferase
MVLKFYGHPSSPPSNRAELILHELQIPFENITIDLLAREQKQEWYTAKHPFGQVPCIVSNFKWETEISSNYFAG